MSIFSRIKLPNVGSSTFNLSYENMLTCNFGDIVPAYIEDVLPGDKFRIRTGLIARTSPLVAPAFVRCDGFLHYFSVPYRLLWTNFQKFRTGGDNPNDYSLENQPYYPRITFATDGNTAVDVDVVKKFITLFGKGSLADYLGFPIVSWNNFQLIEGSTNYKLIAPLVYDLLPFCAYQFVYDEFYRDENYEDKQFKDGAMWNWLHDSSNSGSVFGYGDRVSISNFINDVDDTNKSLHKLFFLRNRAYRHDYFTCALPDTQKGPEVNVPLNNGLSSLPLQHGRVNGAPVPVSPTPVAFEHQSYFYASPTDDKTSLVERIGTDNVLANVTGDIDVSALGGVNINDLRTMSSIQRWFELNARAGGRLYEYILSHFGVRISDSRIDRPEYLGGGVTPVKISEVVNTSGTVYDDENEPLGTLAGRGRAEGVSNKARYRAEEDGIIIGLFSIIPRTMYAGGMPRMYQKFDRMDYYDPMFQNLGEQAVRTSELTYQGGDPTDSTTFGYVPRFAEYKYHPSSYHGDFLTSLRFWHLGRQAEVYKQSPDEAGGTLDSSMLTSNSNEFIKVGRVPDINRIFNITSNDYHHFIVDFYHDVRARRRMKKYVNPSLR